MEIMAASGRVPVQMWLREVYNFLAKWLTSNKHGAVYLVCCHHLGFVWLVFKKALGFRHN